MPFEVKKINPIDRQPRKAVGVSIPFTGKGVFNSTFTTQEAIKSNIINYLLTGRGERYMNPNFGSGLRNQLFNNVTVENLTTLEFRIQQDLELYFSNLDITNVSINAEEDNNLINCSINFSIKDTLIEDEININFE